ncbi:DUF3857 domain-containing protein [Bacteroides sp. GM023]|uniref:DUF3857 domain-containing protein n=1 Tax=Bacteroides sp. GM023 TaxID=2723058 RepID=UPI00168B2985|nr:DUF3857 domain-containing protein [Bacteroides sp. GM023]MBD3592419.1 DUF3858 domain-containing protein [Bacteroides sp. GM023]
MKNIHYYIAVLAMLLSMALPMQAASEAEFGKLNKSYTIHTDGSQEMRVQKELTLFTHAAMNSLYGESFIIYNPEFQELKIHESYTRQKDGTIVKTPANAFVEVLPSAAADAPAYNGLKEMVVVHTGLELGATIYLDYSVITRPGYLPELDVCEQIEEFSPIKEYTFSLSVPESKPLHYELLNGKAAPAVKTTDGVKTVTWTLRNVQPRPRMLDVSLPAGNVQAIVASTYASKADALKVIKQQMGDNGEEITELAQKLTANTKNTEQKKQILAAYVQGLGNCRLSLSQTGYRLRPAAEVIRSAYGTEAEKAALLVALQEAIGVQTEIKAVFPKTEDKDAAGLAAVSGLFVDSHTIADMQDFVSVVNMDAQPISLKPLFHAVSRTDTLNVTSQAGKSLNDGYQMFSLPQARSGWAGYDARATTMNTTRPVNLLLRYLPDETYTCVINIADKMKPVVLPTDKKVENAIGTIEVAVKKTADKIEIVRTLKLKKQLITPAEYPAYYRLMAEWMDTDKTTLLFQSAQ